MATAVVALSMLVAPALFAGSERFIMLRLGARPERKADPIIGPAAPVIICGFGRMGQIVGRVLRMQRIPFTALEKDVEQVDAMRRFGSRVYLGNPAREEILRAAGADKAAILVVALDDIEETNAVVETARRHFVNLTILARARDRRHAHRLMEFGIKGIVRETFFSSLHLSELVLEELSVPADRARRAITLFREHDERTLIATQPIAGDERRLIQSTREAAQELIELFEADQSDRLASDPAAG